MAYSLFEVYGVEMEYMIVDRNTLAVKAIADELMKKVAGDYVSDYENGTIEWSNELVNHVVEIKTHKPEASLLGLEKSFHANVLQINEQLADLNAMLLPTGAHPLMDPFTETRLWPHEHREIYNLYNRIFDCRGHGWSNLQSTHINLPFNGDEEFRKLHAAIRVLLPIIPALCASTPLMNGKYTGFVDGRLETYRHNQNKFPVIAGKIIPEAVFTPQDYHQQIFEPIRTAIAPFDKDNILDQHFLNSRGAIARFDRGAIEIRIIDIQECPLADISILVLISRCLQALVNETWSPVTAQTQWNVDPLADIFLDVVKAGENAEIKNSAYLQLFGIEETKLQAHEIWQLILNKLENPLPEPYLSCIQHILRRGSLSNRIMQALPTVYGPADIREIYIQLAQCLQQNKQF